MEATSANTDSAPAERNSVDLIDKVYTILEKAGSPLAASFRELPYVKEAEGKPEQAQRVLINRQLRMHLGAMPTDTSIARLALDDNCHPSEYFKHFKQHTLPHLVPQTKH